MGCLAAAAEDDFAGEILSADAAAGLLHQLWLLAGDELDAHDRGQIELIRKRTGPLDEGLQIFAARRFPNFAGNEPGGREAHGGFGRRRLPPKPVEREPNAVGEQFVGCFSVIG